MKKLLISALSILVICLGLLYSRDFIDNSSSGEKQTLTIFNWGEYIDPELIKKFEAETGIKVVYETFDSNEAMLTKIQSGSTPYDIVIPSDYMIKKMKKLNLLNKLDHSKLEGFDNIDKQFINLTFDPNNEYSVPYFWGTLGIVYNNSKWFAGASSIFHTYNYHEKEFSTNSVFGSVNFYVGFNFGKKK